MKKIFFYIGIFSLVWSSCTTTGPFTQSNQDGIYGIETSGYVPETAVDPSAPDHAESDAPYVLPPNDYGVSPYTSNWSTNWNVGLTYGMYPWNSVYGWNSLYSPWGSPYMGSSWYSPWGWPSYSGWNNPYMGWNSWNSPWGWPNYNGWNNPYGWNNWNSPYFSPGPWMWNNDAGYTPYFGKRDRSAVINPSSTQPLIRSIEVPQRPVQERDRPTRMEPTRMEPTRDRTQPARDRSPNRFGDFLNNSLDPTPNRNANPRDSWNPSRSSEPSRTSPRSPSRPPQGSGNAPSNRGTSPRNR